MRASMLLAVGVLALPGMGLAQSAASASAVTGGELVFDFPGLEIGVAEYDQGPTGATVFLFPKGFRGAAVDIRGGAPGTLFTDALRLGDDPAPTAGANAICFAGGSSYGIVAAMGVQAELLSSGRADTKWDGNVAFVPAAIIFDFAVRYNAIYPDKELGRAALRAARPGRFPLGARGAGRSAGQGGYFREGEPSGQGGAVRQIGPTKIAVFTVVNSSGTIVDRQGQVARCNHDPSVVGRSVTEHFRHAAQLRAEAGAHSAETPTAVTRNTTLTLVVTNQKLKFWELQRLAVQTHTSMARAIQPFQTMVDGDALFAVTTDEVENPALDIFGLAVAASETAWDAVLSSLPPGRPALAEPLLPVPPPLRAAAVGRYEFRKGAEVTIVAEGDKLVVRSTGSDLVWGFELKESVELLDAGGQLVLRNRWHDRIRLVRNKSGRVTSLVLSRGPRIASALRVDSPDK